MSKEKPQVRLTQEEFLERVFIDRNKLTDKAYWDYVNRAVIIWASGPATLRSSEAAQRMKQLLSSKRPFRKPAAAPHAAPLYAALEKSGSVLCKTDGVVALRIHEGENKLPENLAWLTLCEERQVSKEEVSTVSLFNENGCVFSVFGIRKA